MRSSVFWWYLGLLCAVAQNDKCEPAIFAAACKKECPSVCENVECTEKASAILFEIYEPTGNFKKHDRYAELPCLIVQDIYYIFSKYKNSDVLGDLNVFRNVELVVENLFDRIPCMTATDVIMLWEYLPGHSKQALRYPAFVKNVLQAGNLKDLDVSTALDLVLFCPASSVTTTSQLEVIKTLAAYLPHDSAVRCALLEESKSVQEPMASKFKPSTEQVAEALGVTLEELHAGCLPCTIPPLAAWQSATPPGWYLSKVSSSCADTCAAHEDLVCDSDDMLSHLDEVDSSVEVLAWLGHFQKKGSKVQCSSGAGNALLRNDFCEYASSSPADDPCLTSSAGAQQLCYCSSNARQLDDTPVTTIPAQEDLTSITDAPVMTTEALSNTSTPLPEFLVLRPGKQCMSGALVNSSTECKRACEFFGFDREPDHDSLQFQLGCTVNLRDEKCQFNTRKTFSIPFWSGYRRPICRQQTKEVAPSLVHTCKRGVLKRLIPTSGDVCIQIEGGAIVGCPIGCRTDSQGRDFCLWETTGEKCIQSLRPSPGGMVPARSKRCSFDGFTTPILADNAYDCQVKCEQDYTCWTVSWSDKVWKKNSLTGRCWRVPGCNMTYLKKDSNWATFFKPNMRRRWTRCNDNEKCSGDELPGVASESDCRAGAEAKAAMAYAFDKKENKCIVGFTCEDDSVDRESNNQIEWYRIDSTEVSYKDGAGKCSAPDGRSLNLQCWTFKYTVGECQLACNQNPSCFAFDFHALLYGTKCCFYGKGVQPTPVTNAHFKCYVRSDERWPKTGDDGVHRRALVPAKQVVGGTCIVGRRLYGRAVCTPENFLKCHKSALLPVRPICCNGVFRAPARVLPCEAVGGWYSSSMGADCNATCRENNLVCTDEALSEHYSDVDTDTKLLATIMTASTDTQAEKCPGSNSEDESAVSCFTAPGKCAAFESNKRRVCYCHKEKDVNNTANSTTTSTTRTGTSTAVSGGPEMVATSTLANSTIATIATITISSTPSTIVGPVAAAGPAIAAHTNSTLMEHIRNNLSAFILGVIAVLLFVVTICVALMSVLVLRTKKKRDRDAVRELHQTQSWVDEMVRSSYLDRNEIIIDIDTEVPGRPWKKIGAGGSGQVYSGRFSTTGRRKNKRVALKESFAAMLSRDDRELLNEVKILIRLAHDNIVHFYGMWKYGRKSFMVMELCPNGDLASALNNPEHDQKQRCKWMLQIAEAFTFLHTRNPPVVHRDLKPANVLLGQENQAKVADFGFARDAHNRDASGKIGTIAYMPPEALKTRARRFSSAPEPSGAPRTPKQPRASLADHTQQKCAWDTYSYAVLMGVVLGGSDAYPGMNKQDIWVAVAMRDERMELSPNIPEEIKELIKMMWHTDCTQRPMFPDVITILRERLYDFMEALDRMGKPRPSQKNSLKQKSNSKSEYAFASSPSSSAAKAPIANDSKAAKRNPNDSYSTDSYCEELSSDEDVSEYGLIRVNSGTSLLKFGVPDFGLRIED